MPGRNIRLSVCSASYGETDLFDVIDRAAALGLDGVEVTAMTHLPAETSAARLLDVRAKLDDSGIAASSLHFIFPGNLSFVDPDAKARSDVARHITRLAEIASVIGAEVVMVGGGGMRAASAGMSRSDAEDRVMGVFDLAAALSDDFGVSLAFESLNRYETNVGNTLGEVLRLIRTTSSRTLGVGADTYHMNIDELDLATAIRATGSDLLHVHLADNHRLAPGDGHIDFASILSALDDIEYTGWMSMELFAITPELLFLPTFELCDREVTRGTNYIRQLQTHVQSVIG